MDSTATPPFLTASANLLDAPDLNADGQYAATSTFHQWLNNDGSARFPTAFQTPGSGP